MTVEVTREVKVHLPTDEWFDIEARTSYAGKLCTVRVQRVAMREGSDVAWVSGWKITKDGKLGQETRHAAVHVDSLPREIRSLRPY